MADHPFGGFGASMLPCFTFELPMASGGFSDLQAHSRPSPGFPGVRNTREDFVLAFQKLQRLFTGRHLQLVTTHAIEPDGEAWKSPAFAAAVEARGGVHVFSFGGSEKQPERVQRRAR